MRQVGRAQRLGVHSVRLGRSRLRTRMRTTTMISIVLAYGDRPLFNSPVARTGDRSCSAGEEARAFDGALLTGAHRPMQARRRALRHRDALCGTVPPHAFVPSAATHHVEVDVARSGRCCGASHNSSPSFFPSLQRYAGALSKVGISMISPFLQPKKIFEACKRFLSKPDKNLSPGPMIL
jgi:hypothetical protein